MGDLVSIVVPIYNVSEYLGKCIDSLVAQDYPNIEVILVDDCSTDDCALIAQKYKKEFPDKIRFIQREKNGGLSAARNTGIRAATGRWLAFSDSDDWITENYISVMYNVAIKEDADMVINSSMYTYYSEDKIEVHDKTPDICTETDNKEKIARMRFSANAKLYKRILFSDTGITFPEDILRCEDLSTVVPLMTKASRISVIHIPTYYYFQRPTSLSNQNQENIDLSFYPATIQRMKDLCDDRFALELEARAVEELLYGMVMIMVRSGRTSNDVSDHIDQFASSYPSWRSNPYISYLPALKKTFIFFASHKCYYIIKIMIKLWDRIK